MPSITHQTARAIPIIEIISNINISPPIQASAHHPCPIKYKLIAKAMNSSTDNTRAFGSRIP
jgi:hypothetical protein